MEITPSAHSALPAVAPAVESTLQTPAEQRHLIQAVKAVDAPALFGESNELTFVLDRDTRKTVVRVVNRQTGDVVMQLPPEYVLAMAKDSEAQARHREAESASGEYSEAETIKG
ncbi:MAG TPA: flagellar protein FlaG [Bryobacteraceae bacterium]|nr:flagellar protein FlaG [Bryobacteraceae bacterium]